MKVIVIGAGTAGLASAIRLKTKGYDVEIFEKNERVGGRMYQIEDNGFKFDVGPTIVMMPDIYQEVFTASGVKAEDYIDMQQVDPMMTLKYKDGSSIETSSDLVKLTKALEAFSHQDAQGYLSYLADVYKRYIIAKDHFIERAFRKKRDFYNFQTLLQAYKLRTLDNAYHSIGRFVKNEKLRQALAFQTLYIGISPFQGPSLYTIIPMIELLYGVFYIKGGMYAMAKAMEKRFLEMGGKIHLHSPVSEILIDKNDKAYGVKVHDHHHEADAVLVNADFPYAVSNLIKNKKHLGKYTPKKIQKMKYSTSSFLLYLGLDKKYPSDVHTIYFANSFEGNIHDIFENKLPNDPSFYIYSPTQIDSSIAPSNHEIVYVLVPVSSLHEIDYVWNDTLIENYTTKILNLIAEDPKYHDIKDHIVVKHIMTPTDFENQFNLKFGATFGLRPTLFQSNYYRPHNTYKYVKNLYFAGSSNHPGAGVPIVLTSAKIAVSEIEKDFKDQ